jgi:hypothetical protein
MQEACAVKLLLPRVSIPKVCDARIVHVEHTIWTQLEQRNEWIYFTPFSDSDTIVRFDREPVEIQLRGTGKLNINSGCEGYSLTSLLNTRSEIQANYTGKGEALLSRVETQFECCEQFGTFVNVSHIELDMKQKPTVTHGRF